MQEAFSPLNETSPAVLWCNPTSVLPNVDFPEPLSPTRPTISCGKHFEADVVHGVDDLIPPNPEVFGNPFCLNQRIHVASPREKPLHTLRRHRVVQPTARVMSRIEFKPRWVVLLAHMHRVGTTCKVSTTTRRFEHVRWGCPR